MHVAGRDGIGGLNNFPLFIFFGHGALNYGAIGAPFEAAKAPRSAQRVEMAAAFGSGGAGSNKRGFVANRAVAIDAVDFDGGARLTVNFAVAVIVLGKMAVVALHAFFQMDVREMDGFPEAVGIIESDLLAVLVEPVPFAVVIEDGTEDPAVAVEIGELRGFQFRVEFRAAEIFEKFFIAPETAGGGGFWIAQIRLIALLFGRIALLRRIHFVAVDFVVPPGETEIRGEHVCAGMDVADHALARRNGAREDMLDGMAGLILRNRRIRRSAETGVAELRIGCRVRRDRGRLRRRRGRRCSRWRDSRRDDRWCQAATSPDRPDAFSASREIRDRYEAPCRNRGRSVWRQAYRDLLRDWDCLVRIFSRRRVRTREGRFLAEKFPSGKAGLAPAARLWCEFLQVWEEEKS